eukprot:755976-Hanusia_phi.AAC.3
MLSHLRAVDSELKAMQNIQGKTSPLRKISNGLLEEMCLGRALPGGRGEGSEWATLIASSSSCSSKNVVCVSIMAT